MVSPAPQSVNPAHMTSSRFAVDVIVRLRCTVVGGGHGDLSRDRGVRSKVSPLVGAGLPGPIAVRGGGSAVVGILPFAGDCSTAVLNMQWLPWPVVRCSVVCEGEYPEFLLSS